MCNLFLSSTAESRGRTRQEFERYISVLALFGPLAEL